MSDDDKRLDLVIEMVRDLTAKVEAIAEAQAYARGKGKGITSIVWSVGGFIASAIIALGTAYVSRASP